MGVSWKDELNIGVYEIDAQHKELFTRLDRFMEATRHGEGSEHVTQLLDFLDDYVHRHFTAEEKLQRLMGYPHLGMHCAEHDSFLKEITKLRGRLMKLGATPELAKLTKEVLQQWLIRHICNTDKVLGAFFNEHRNREWERYLRDHF
jgi:hemerythrin